MPTARMESLRTSSAEADVVLRPEGAHAGDPSLVVESHDVDRFDRDCLVPSLGDHAEVESCTVSGHPDGEQFGLVLAASRYLDTVERMSSAEAIDLLYMWMRSVDMKVAMPQPPRCLLVPPSGRRTALSLPPSLG